MKEEFKDIKLLLGDTSLDQTLGIYYIDMRPAKRHYTENIYNGGFDENGVPFCGYGDGFRFYPINIAQYGFILHAEYLESASEQTLHQLKKCVEKLVELASISEDDCIWWHQFEELKYKIPAPWASAMAQGEIISLFLRYYQISGENFYLELAKKAYHFMRHDLSEKGVRRMDENGYLWFEEYPSKPPSFVLNGYIYALFGLYDLYRVTQDSQVKEDIDACVLTLKNNIKRFDAGYWSYYDILKKELVRYYYQKNVHVPQLEILHRLTGEMIFLKYKVKWEKTVTPLHFCFVQIMYRVLPRWNKLKKLWTN